MAIRALFSTQIYTAPLGSPRPAALNQQLLLESLQLRRDDRAGRAWSRSNYPGGYTSYNSLCQLQRISPSFAQLELRLARHVARFARALELDLRGRRLAMTDCWVNIMRRRVVHGRHLLRAHAAGLRGPEIRGPAAGAFHGRAAAPGERPDAQSRLGHAARDRRPAGAV